MFSAVKTRGSLNRSGEQEALPYKYHTYRVLKLEAMICRVYAFEMKSAEKAMRKKKI